eukprot:gene5513-2150_t
MVSEARDDDEANEELTREIEECGSFKEKGTKLLRALRKAGNETRRWIQTEATDQNISKCTLVG